MMRVWVFREWRSVWRLTMTNGRELEKAWRAVQLADPCVYCGGVAEELDHIQAVSRRGSDAWENRAPTCRSCNEVKQAAGLLFFLAVRQRIASRAARKRKYRTEQHRQAAVRTILLAACRSAGSSPKGGAKWVDNWTR